MGPIARGLQGWMPLIMVAFLAVAVVQLALQLGVSLNGINAALHAAWPGLAAIGLAGWVAVAAGLAHEARGGARRKGWFMDVLSRLTNRAALEEMLDRTDTARAGGFARVTAKPYVQRTDML
jgi:hypothetical protein